MHCSIFNRNMIRKTALAGILALFLPAAAYSADVTLGWQPPDDGRVTGYHVYYGPAGTAYKSTPKMTIGSAVQSSTVISALEGGQTYAFAMTSIDADGNESAFSEEVTHAIPLDSDGDGVSDSIDGCPNDPAKTNPGACGCGVIDTDTDGDGTPDCLDNCPNDAAKIDPGACGCGSVDADTDGDGTPDCNDQCPLDPGKIAPGDCGCGSSDIDTDRDGVSDCDDLCPNDPAKTAPGDCGCGISDRDSDGDGISDCLDDCDATLDSDRDGVSDCDDLCPNDPDKTAPGDCGCNVSEQDSDGDGLSDCIDADDDNDGMPDQWEKTYGLNPLVDDAADDLDGDGISNIEEFQAGSDPSEILENLPPEAPLLLSPPDSAVDMNRNIFLETGAFADPENDAHAATEWQISSRSDFSELVLDTHTDKKLTRLAVTHVVFAENQTYYWRARYFDDRGAQSEWSAVNMFTTGSWGRDKNNNGISDASESLLATDLDANGVPDSSQDDMKSIQVLDTDKQVGIQYDLRNTIEYIEGVDPLMVEDQTGMPDSLPFGLINFKIKVAEPGQTVVVTVYLSEPAPKGARWFKYDDGSGWQDYSDLATFAPNRKSVELVLEDGGYGDIDGVANGVIIDPSGVGLNALSEESSGGGGGGSCFINSMF